MTPKLISEYFMKACMIILKFTVLILIWQNIVFSQEVFNSEYLQIPSDSIVMDRYKEVTYFYADSSGNNVDRYNMIRIFKDDTEIISFGEGISELLDFCQVLSYIKNDCYLQDINKDGYKELIIVYSTGGGSCCEGAGFLYSVRDNATLLLSMEPTVVGFQITDIENDSIPEIISHDGVFNFFSYYNYREFSQPLIWRWDGNKYRIANARFAKYILNQLGPNQLPPESDWYQLSDLQVTAHSSIAMPSESFWDMVFSYYMAGRPKEADSLFSAFWPPAVPDRDKYLQDIKSRINSDPYWPQILDSNW
jgi:hypothetical protein